MTVDAPIPATLTVAGRTVTGLTADSRQVQPGWLFAALPGSRTDGRSFIGDAVARGAAVVLAPEGTPPLSDAPDTALLTDPLPRRRFAQLAAAFCRRQPVTIAAVTGTSGKSSTVHFARQLWQALGHPAASLGTLGIAAPGFERYGALTTPDPMALHGALADLADNGIDHLAMEASSHGLDQYRLDAVAVSAAGFTNLSRDHLDYHGTMAAYFKAKARLFDVVLPPDGMAVINADDQWGAQLIARCRVTGRRTWTYGKSGGELVLHRVAPTAGGLAVAYEILGRPLQAELPFGGGFQAYNVLCALGLVLAGIDEPSHGDAITRLAAALPTLGGVRGRLERVAVHPNGAPIYVDYAHKPAALKAVLAAMRPHAVGALSLVFGCGGDRDAGKRPEMGGIAEQLADHVVVTDDNPRSEEPAAIRRAILAACPKAIEIGDRAEAIAYAVGRLAPGDLLVIAGKGHETGQTVGQQVRPFDDAEQARQAVRAMAEG